ncbi:MAG: hypothetical protein WCA06_16800, partial [Terrimicrobiaceae bacterium]
IVIHKLRKYPEPVVSSVSCVIAHRTIVIHEPHQARIFDSPRLILRSWKNDHLGPVAVLWNF